MIISLCGFMGTGKSTIGRNLANYTYSEYVDLDIYIENEYQYSVQQFFIEYGEARFREVEYMALKEIITKHQESSNKNLVISLGGGTIVNKQSAKIIKEQTFCIYLYSNSEILIKRLVKNNNKRPLLSGKDGEKIEDTVIKLLKYRDPIYRDVSQWIIDSQNLSVKEIVEKISMVFE